MADHSGPTTSTNYLTVLSQIDGRIDDALLGLDPASTTATNVPTNAIRWSSAGNKWQKWNGSAWNDLSTGYAIPLALTASNYTPTIAFGTPGTSSFSYATQSGTFFRIGKLVFVITRVVFTPTIGTGSGTVRVSLPSTADAGAYAMSIAELQRDAASEGWEWPALTNSPAGSFATSVSMYAGNSNNYALVRALGHSGLATNFTTAALTNGSSHTIAFSGWYLEA